MKYVFLLATVAVIYFFLLRKAPVAPVVSAVTQQELPSLTSGPRGGETPAPAAAGAPAEHTNALKRPIDRTREVLGQVKKNNSGNEF